MFVEYDTDVHDDATGRDGEMNVALIDAERRSEARPQVLLLRQVEVLDADPLIQPLVLCQTPSVVSAETVAREGRTHG